MEWKLRCKRDGAGALTLRVSGTASVWHTTKTRECMVGTFKAAWKKEFELAWRKAGPLKSFR